VFVENENGVDMALELMAHQAKAVLVSEEFNRYAFFWEPGAGKTIAMLAIIDRARRDGFFGKTVVLCPKSIMQTAWAADARNFTGLTATVCWADSKNERLDLIQSGAEVLITNYECFKKHLEDFWAAGVRRLVIDESSKVKSPTSQITKACIAFADRCSSVYILSGTPAPNDHTEYWSQMRIVDRSIFGPHYYGFCYNYFAPQKRMIQGKERIIGWKPLADRKDEFTERLRLRSWSLTKDECLDLPEQTDVVREVGLSGAEIVAYHSMLQELKVESAGSDTITAKVQAKAMKLRQITGGAIIDGGMARTLGTSKIDEMSEVLDELGPQPVVIWAEFTNEIDRIADRCRERKESVAIIDGRAGNRADIINAFQAGKIQRLVCHPAAAGHGVTLTAAAYDIFFSHSFSFETYEQARNRIHRTGQKRKVVHYHLIVPKTIDERVWAALKTKQNGHVAIMELLGRNEGVLV
jgi:SNF2 family DNA or RNA helicase